MKEVEEGRGGGKEERRRWRKVGLENEGGRRWEGWRMVEVEDGRGDTGRRVDGWR